MDALTLEPLALAALALAALLIGATGTWSPCGFSMIETLGPTGHTGGLPTTLAASLSFAPFALVGGAITFGAMALAGSLLGGPGPVALAAAAVVALAAAAAEARGLPIVPQVRRQLPVRWRSRMPMPVAAAGYGVLLGLGFTTFVLSYGVWALMGISLALGEPLAGVVIGLCFGIGRATPIVLLAPLADRPSGERICESMAMRPSLLRGMRIGDAAALALAAFALAGAAGAEAARKEVPKASDPSAAGPALAYERNSGAGELRGGDGETVPLPGSDPATGGPWLAVVDRRRVRVLDRAGLEAVGAVGAAGADATAITRRWLAFRVRQRGRDKLKVARLRKNGKPKRARVVAKARAPAQLSRPAVDGGKLVVAVAKRGRSKLIRYRLRNGKKPRRRTLISTRTEALTGPSVSGKKIAYVRTTRKRQTVRLKGLGGGKGRRIYARRGTGPPTLWTTAISGKRVLVTVVKRGGASKIISVGR